jgi:hypothetical protein
VTLIIGWGTSIKVVLLVLIISSCCFTSIEGGLKEYEFIKDLEEPTYFHLNIMVMQ